MQLFAVVLFILYWTTWHSDQSAAPEYAVAESSTDVQTFVYLSEDLEVGCFADVEANCHHFVDSAGGEEGVLFKVVRVGVLDGLGLHHLGWIFPGVYFLVLFLQFDLFFLHAAILV